MILLPETWQFDQVKKNSTKSSANKDCLLIVIGAAKLWNWRFTFCLFWKNARRMSPSNVDFHFFTRQRPVKRRFWRSVMTLRRIWLNVAPWRSNHCSFAIKIYNSTSSPFVFFWPTPPSSTRTGATRKRSGLCADAGEALRFPECKNQAQIIFN